MRCSRCKKQKTASEMKKSKSRSYVCKNCHAESMISYYQSAKGLITRIYANQRESCRNRKHQYPLYSKNELSAFLLSNKTFLSLFVDWASSGYKKNLAPSLDRIDESKTYSFDNIRIVTFEENMTTHAEMTKKGIGSSAKQCKPVLQFAMDGNFVKEYISVNAARRETGILGIPHSLKGRHTHAGHFIWKFKE